MPLLLPSSKPALAVIVWVNRSPLRWMWRLITEPLVSKPLLALRVLPTPNPVCTTSLIGQIIPRFSALAWLHQSFFNYASFHAAYYLTLMRLSILCPTPRVGKGWGYWQLLTANFSRGVGCLTFLIYRRICKDRFTTLCTDMYVDGECELRVYNILS